MEYKKALLNMGEEFAKQLVHEVLKPMAKEYAENSPNKIDDVLLPFLDYAESALMTMIDKIDGEPG